MAFDPVNGFRGIRSYDSFIRFPHPHCGVCKVFRFIHDRTSNEREASGGLNQEMNVVVHDYPRIQTIEFAIVAREHAFHDSRVARLSQ